MTSANSWVEGGSWVKERVVMVGEVGSREWEENNGLLGDGWGGVDGDLLGLGDGDSGNQRRGGGFSPAN